jgi:methyl-accepting chemotaxis protein
MSDHRIVSIDSAQFAKFEKLVGDITTTLENKLAHIERTLKPGLDALAQGGGSGDNSQVLTAINNLIGKVDTMSSNIDRIEKEAADAAENVGLVRTAIEDLKSASAAMQAEIASLKDQVAKGQVDQARLDAAAATFEKADDDIDAIVLPTPPTDTPAEG